MNGGTPDREPPGWYEASLPTDERKRRGHFSTPLALVDQILDACGYTSQTDISNLRVLDPACGSGNFLTRATRRLCAACGEDSRRAARLVQRNIWGMDPDPVACFLAEMQVCAEFKLASGLCPPSFRPQVHQGDSLLLPWEPCVDLLLANPPYLAAKNTDLSHYRLAQQRGQMDSYLLFLDLALLAVRPGGWIGLILPDPVLARANAAPERARLLSECRLQHIWHLSGVFAADVGAVVVVAQKLPPHALHRVAWQRTRWNGASIAASQTRSQVSQLLLTRQPDSALRYLLSTRRGSIIERLRVALETAQEPAELSLLPLGQLVNIKRGEELGRSSPVLNAMPAATEQSYPVLLGGGDIRPYVRPATERRIPLAAIRKPVERYLSPKLLVVKSTDHLQAALDLRGHAVLQTLYLLLLPQGRYAASEEVDILFFLLALLNSRLLSTYLYHLHTAYKLVQPQIEQAVLARLPIPWGSPETRREISERARTLEGVCSASDAVVEWKERQFAALYEAQERAIRALYVAASARSFNDEELTLSF